MQTADWIVVAASFVAMVVITVIAFLRQRDTREYFTAGHRIRRFLMVLFAFGSGTPTDTQSSVMTSTWNSGLSGLWWQFLWLPIIPFYWIVAPLLRRLRAITTADFFSMRFGPSTAALYCVYGMVISIILMASVLFGGAKLLDVLTDPFFADLAGELNLSVPVIDLVAGIQPPSPDRPPVVIWKPVNSENLAACTLGVVLILMTIPGGLRAVIAIDAIQGILRIGLTLILFWVVLRHIGGFGSVHTQDELKPGMLDFVASDGSAIGVSQEVFTPFYLTTLAIAAVAGIIAQPHVIMICGAARTEMGARIGFTFGNLLKRFMAVLWTFTGLACIVWYLGDSSPLNRPDAAPESQQLYRELKLAASPNTADLAADQVAAIRIRNTMFADRLFGRVVREVFRDIGTGMMGLAVSLILVSAVSHCGTQMIAGSGLFAEHLYRNHLSPGRPASHYLFVGRLCGPLLIAAAILLQTTFSNLSDALKLVIKTPAVIGISMWMGLFWTRWSTVSVWVTTVTAAALGFLCGYHPEEIQKTLPDLTDIMFINGPNGLLMRESWKIVCILGGGLLAGVVASILADNQADGQLDQFYRVLRTPVAPEETDYAEQFLPPDDGTLAPAVSILGFQFPGPTRVGTAGFLIASLLVVGMIYAAKWLSLSL